jgi:hypothetical protein
VALHDKLGWSYNPEFVIANIYHLGLKYRQKKHLPKPDALLKERVSTSEITVGLPRLKGDN